MVRASASGAGGLVLALQPCHAVLVCLKEVSTDTDPYPLTPSLEICDRISRHGV